MLALSHARTAHTAHTAPLQLEGLAKELKRKQKDLKENSSGNVFHRARFLDLRKLLGAKAALARLEGVEGGGGGEGEGKAGEANMLEVREA